jgi:hypothetical protein
MTAKSNKKRFSIGAKITVEVMATDITEAVEIAKTLKLDDFVSFEGGHNDSSLHINSVFEQL